MHSRLGIAAFVVKVMCALVALAIITHGVGEVTGLFDYKPDDWEIGLFNTILGAGTFVLTLSGLGALRLLRRKDEPEE